MQVPAALRSLHVAVLVMLEDLEEEDVRVEKVEEIVPWFTEAEDELVEVVVSRFTEADDELVEETVTVT